MLVRLQKILSAAGVASRRASEALIQQGRVSVNGIVVRELARAPIRMSTTCAPMAGALAVQRLRYVLLNKPRGYVTTRSDPEGRPTVLDLLKGVREYVYPVGRLDYDSEGLLLLTNDGDLAARLMHPRHEVERVYEARVLGVPDPHDIERLRRGLVIEGRRTSPALVALVDSSAVRTNSRATPRRPGAGADRARVEGVRQDTRGAQAVVRITIYEGRSRQVRKMCDGIGHPVTRLRRVRIGPISDPTLKVGGFRELTAREVAALKRVAGASPPQ